jgi:hypothetical protein
MNLVVMVMRIVCEEVFMSCFFSPTLSNKSGAVFGSRSFTLERNKYKK